MFNLSLSYGNQTSLLRVTSLDPRKPAAIIVQDSHGISLIADGGTPESLDILIDHLFIVGTTGTTSTFNGIHLSSNTNIVLSTLIVDSVDISGFGATGMLVERKSGPPIYGIYISNSKFHDNPGALSAEGYVGVGLLLRGVLIAKITSCEFYNNGANSNKGFSGGFLVYDANDVWIFSSYSHDNKCPYLGGAGFEIQKGTQNVEIAYCTTANNEGLAFVITAYNDPSNFGSGEISNVLIRDSKSTGDGSRYKYAATSVYGQLGAITYNAAFRNVYIEITASGVIPTHFGTAGFVGLYLSGNFSKVYSDHVVYNFTMTNPPVVFNSFLVCNSDESPVCSA